MRTIKIAITSCLMVGLAAGGSLAQKGAGTGSAAAAAGSGAAAAAKPGAGAGTGSAAKAGMEMPKPPQALLDMAKNMGGTWKCTGKVHMPDGNVQDYTANVSGKLDLDKQWWHETLTQTKSKTPFKFEAYMTVDAKTNKWTRVQVDNMGVTESSTSDDGKSWTGTTTGMGMTAKTKATVTPGDKTMSFAAQMSMDGKTWMPSVEMDCKK